MRVRLRDRLENEAKAVARRRLEEEIVRELVKRNSIELPERLVEHRLQRMYESAVGGRDDDKPAVDTEEFRRVYRPVVEHQLRAGLLL